MHTFFIREYCICCEGDENFDCPLCDNERFFEDEYSSYGLEDFMVDFYRETILDPNFRRKSDTEKKHALDIELEEYFRNQ